MDPLSTKVRASHGRVSVLQERRQNGRGVPVDNLDGQTLTLAIRLQVALSNRGCHRQSRWKARARPGFLWLKTASLRKASQAVFQGKVSLFHPDQFANRSTPIGDHDLRALANFL